MKNIHLLPTKEPSRLKKINDTVYLHKDDLFIFDGFRYNHNLYVTNNEEIKEGDYKFDKFHKNVSKVNFISQVTKYDKKIILTTDTKLIENGVQEIVLDYLKWFVKNPSCEFVETKLVNINNNNIYEILLPKKEKAKQELKKCVCKEPDFDIMKGLCKNCGNSTTYLGERIFVETKQNIIDNFLEINNNPEINKQVEAEIKELEEKATLEEVAQNYEFTNGIYGFKAGAEWQAKQMYSKEDMKQAFLDGMFYNSDDTVENAVKEWFEQYKK